MAIEVRLDLVLVQRKMSLTELSERIGEGDQCFIAMWYDDKIMEYYNEFIAPAVKDSGFEPYLVAKDPHDERIDNHIIGQIRKSRFMIADLTGGRGGVYYEAGYAQGIGLPVMWCCNKEWSTLVPILEGPDLREIPKEGETVTCEKWSKLLHFDIRQLPFNFWKDGENWGEMVKDWIDARRHLITGRLTD